MSFSPSFTPIDDFLLNKTNFHTHCNFCDGKDEISEVVEAAKKLDFKTLGISSHAMYPWAGDCHIGAFEFEKYCEEVLKAKENCKNALDVKLGFEVEYIPGLSFPTYETYEKFSPDFLIGSVHYLYTEKGTFAVDYGYDKITDGIKKYFNGDSKKFIQSYFDLQKQMLHLRTNDRDFQILGHPDLIRKLNGKLHYFDENDSWYKNELKEMVKEIKKSQVIVEINTGGIARGYTTSPYPSKEFLTMLVDANVPVTISSDCHNKDMLDFWFPEAVQFAKSCGVKEIVTSF